MGKEERVRLLRTLNSHFDTVHETLQVLDQPPPSSLEKESWEHVIKMADEVSKQATIAGMVWTGERPDMRALEQNMASYFNILQGFLLLSHGSLVGAGPTLSSNIHASVKLVVDCSFKFWKESLSSYGSRNKNLKISIPALTGAIWDACAGLKKTPSTNTTAIGRAITQVAVSMKDVLREMKELKPSASDFTDESSSKAGNESNNNEDDDDSSENELGNDLSADEMKVAQSAIGVVSGSLVFVKELIRVLTGLVKLKNGDERGKFVDSLEKILKLCQGFGIEVDEIGASLYPPQEIPVIKAGSEKIFSIIDGVQMEVGRLEGHSEGFLQACNSLRACLRQLEIELGFPITADMETKLLDVTLSN